MSTPEDERHSGRGEVGDDRCTDGPAGRAEYRKELSDLVDDIEDRVAEKRRSEAVPGDAAERADTIPVDAGDEAPD